MHEKVQASKGRVLTIKPIQCTFQITINDFRMQNVFDVGLEIGNVYRCYERTFLGRQFNNYRRLIRGEIMLSSIIECFEAVVDITELFVLTFEFDESMIYHLLRE